MADGFAYTTRSMVLVVLVARGAIRPGGGWGSSTRSWLARFSRRPPSAIAFGDGSMTYLGTQGDEWNAQRGMLCALIGANAALILLGRIHD